MTHITMEKSIIISVTVLVLINITDAITNSVIAPTLIFYVRDMGGTKEQYGLIMSASYLAGIVTMSFYGAWVDANGNKYHAPYAASFIFGIIGSLIYFLAILFPKGNIAMIVILIGRIIIGFGSSGRTLAYSWVSTAIPRDQQRTTLTIMSMTRSVGMILGPLINTLVAKVSFNFLGVIPINPYNVAGLILAFGETILFIATAIFLIDPPTKIDTATKNDTPKTTKKNVGWKDITTALTDFDLFLPMMNLFCLMCNFTFYQVAIPPVASNAFHWSPVTISTVLAAQAVILFIGMVTSMLLSMTKVADITMIIGGNLCFVIGGIMTYYTWTGEAESWQFVAPIMIVSLAYPFIGPANRSKYTRAVHDRPELEGSHGVMQSLFNQSYMVGGFIAPNFVTTFILRTPEEVKASGSSHELSPWTWFIPISSLIMILGLIYEEVILGKNELGLFPRKVYELEEETPATEATQLLREKRVSKRRRSSVVEIKQRLSAQYEMDRRHSVEAVGIINPFETRDEHESSDELMKDKKAWEELAKLDASIEGEDE